MHTSCLSSASSGRISLATSPTAIYNSFSAARRFHLAQGLCSRLPKQDRQAPIGQHPASHRPEQSTCHPNGTWCLSYQRDDIGNGEEQPDNSFSLTAANSLLGLATVLTLAAANGLGTIPTVHEPTACDYALSTVSSCRTEAMPASGTAMLATAPEASNITAPANTYLAAAVGQKSSTVVPKKGSSPAVTTSFPASPASPPPTPSLGAAAEAASYLPPALLAHVPASIQDYWSGVRQAQSEGLLHATLYVSAKAWPHFGPTIAAMVGPSGAGPSDQVRFALVPLGDDYAVRAAQAQASGVASQLPPPAPQWQQQQQQPPAQGPGSNGQCEGEELARRFGLDVTLASFALGSASKAGTRGRPLEVCPAMVVRGGYSRSAQPIGDVCPPWRMRQDLDEHVRRNLALTPPPARMQEYRLRSTAGARGMIASSFAGNPAVSSAVTSGIKVGAEDACVALDFVHVLADLACLGNALAAAGRGAWEAQLISQRAQCRPAQWALKPEEAVETEAEVFSYCV